MSSVDLPILLALVLAFVSTTVLTEFYRRWALSRAFLDQPNYRSSHEKPTPHGGGVVFVIVYSAFVLFWLVYAESTYWALLAVVVIASLAIAALGFWDDKVDIRARNRFVLQLLIAGCLVVGVGGNWLGNVTPFEWIALPVVILAVVWWLNLYNFMDGIDGIAASEGVFVSVGAAVLLRISSSDSYLITPLLALAFVLLGFLIHNWSPAKLFMGDVGSCFLGIVLAGIALISIGEGLLPVWTWMILTAFFWTDATLTLIRRMLRGEVWYQAHRSHAYQILSRRLQSHARVTVLCIGVNVLWLLPLAALTTFYPNFGVGLVVLAVAPLFLIQLKIGAGYPAA